MARFAFVFDLRDANPNTYTRARQFLGARGWNVDEQRSFYLAPEEHGLVQCIEDLHGVVADNPDFGAAVNSAHLVEFTMRNDVGDLLRGMSEALAAG